MGAGHTERRFPKRRLPDAVGIFLSHNCEMTSEKPHFLSPNAPYTESLRRFGCVVFASQPTHLLDSAARIGGAAKTQLSGTCVFFEKLTINRCKTGKIARLFPRRDEFFGGH